MKTTVCRILLSFAAAALFISHAGAQLRRAEKSDEETRLLSPADFEYQGFFRPPLELEGGGTLTGRVTDGQVSLMMLNKSQLLYEFDVPPSLTYKKARPRRVQP